MTQKLRGGTAHWGFAARPVLDPRSFARTVCHLSFKGEPRRLGNAARTQEMFRVNVLFLRH